MLIRIESGVASSSNLETDCSKLPFDFSDRYRPKADIESADHMNNNLDRAKKWSDFIILNSQYPHPEKLKQHLRNADFLDFCDCGCNSFAVRHRNELTQSTLVNAGSSGLFFEAAFQAVGKDKTVEILLFSDEHGYLNYVEIDCCGNSQPVTNDIELHPTPFHVYVGKSVASD